MTICQICGKQKLATGEVYVGDFFGCKGHDQSVQYFPQGVPAWAYQRPPSPWICPLCGRANSPLCEWCDHEGGTLSTYS